MSGISMKPFQIVLLSIFGLLALVGLFFFANYGGLGGTSTSVGKVLIWGTLPQQAVDASIASLKSANKDYTGVSYVQYQTDTFSQQLTEALASGQGPDLIILSQEGLVAQQQRVSLIPFSAISERTYIDTFLPITELFLSGEGTYALPLAVDPLVLYVNRTILGQAGIAQPPTNWEGVLGSAQQLTQRTGQSLTQSAIPLGTYENSPNARAILSLLFLQSGAPITQVEGGTIRAKLSSSGESAFGMTPPQAVLSFFMQFADPAKTVYTWNVALPNARDAFTAGTVALYPGFASELGTLRATNPNLNVDMAAIPQPQNGRNKITYGVAYGLAITRTSPNAAGALRTALALSGDAYGPTIASALGMAPARRASLVPSGSDRFQPIYFPAALIAQAWLSPDPAATDRIFSTMIGNIASGRQAVGQALVTADQALDAALSP